MTVNRKDMTITWHVNNLKCSHVDAYEVTKVIYRMKGIYGSHMKESRGNKHDYLIMDLDLSLYGKVRVTMMYCLKKIVSIFTETIQVIVATPV